MRNQYFNLFKITQWVARQKVSISESTKEPKEFFSSLNNHQIKYNFKDIPSHIARRFSLQVFESKNAIVLYEVEIDFITKDSNDFGLLKDICLFFNVEDLNVLPTIDFPLQGTNFSFQNAHDLLTGIVKKFQKDTVILFGENIIYFYLKEELKDIRIIQKNIFLPFLSQFTKIENKKLLNQLGYLL